VGETSRSDRADARADRLLASASQLLILQPALAGELPQAFLKTLAALRSGRDGGQAALLAYGAFYRLLAASEHGTWRAALLSSLLGTTTVFSEKAAAGKPLPGALQAAVAADLNRLSELCLKEGTLAGWVAEAAELRDSTGTALWLSSSQVEAPGEESDTGTAHPGSPASPGACRAVGLQLETDGVWGNEWEALAAFHRTHGHGPVALHGVLAWADGGLVAAEKWAAEEVASSPTLPAHPQLGGFARGELRRALFFRAGFSRDAPPLTLGAVLCAEPALRAVLLPKAELRSLPALLAALRLHPASRFAVIVRDVSLVPFSESYSALLSTLRSARDAVPSNVALLVYGMQGALLRQEGKEALATEGGALEAAFDEAESV